MKNYTSSGEKFITDWKRTEWRSIQYQPAKIISSFLIWVWHYKLHWKLFFFCCVWNEKKKRQINPNEAPNPLQFTRNLRVCHGTKICLITDLHYQQEQLQLWRDIYLKQRKANVLVSEHVQMKTVIKQMIAFVATLSRPDRITGLEGTFSGHHLSNSLISKRYQKKRERETSRNFRG